jgi:hypothetical protein
MTLKISNFVSFDGYWSIHFCKRTCFTNRDIPDQPSKRTLEDFCQQKRFKKCLTLKENFWNATSTEYLRSISSDRLRSYAPKVRERCWGSSVKFTLVRTQGNWKEIEWNLDYMFETLRRGLSRSNVSEGHYEIRISNARSDGVVTVSCDRWWVKWQLRQVNFKFWNVAVSNKVLN